MKGTRSTPYTNFGEYGRAVYLVKQDCALHKDRNQHGLKTSKGPSGLEKQIQSKSGAKSGANGPE